MLAADEARTLLDSIDITIMTGLRDWELIALITYTFAHVSAVIQMQGEDVYVKVHRTWIRLHKRGGKSHDMTCHHNL